MPLQQRYSLGVDGVTGRHTLEKLDELLRAPVAPPRTAGLPYRTGIRTSIAQPSPMGCWATVYTMMKSWKDRCSYPIRECWRPTV